MMKYDDLESLIEKCLAEIEKASEGHYDPEDAERAASLVLKTQMKLGFYIEEVELKSRNSKNEISRIEGEKYYEIKGEATTKITDAALSAAIAKSNDVVEAKRKYAEDESALKKWNYLSNVLNNSHLYFRGFNKKNNGM